MVKLIDLYSKKQLLNLKNEIKRLNYQIYFQTDRIENKRKVKYRLEKVKFPLRKKIEPEPYKKYVEKNKKKLSIGFWNLKKNTYLVVPKKPYLNINDFAKKSTDKEWLAIFNKARKYLKKGDYFSTHGHGVAWLHLRIENPSKYYKW